MGYEKKQIEVKDAEDSDAEDSDADNSDAEDSDTEDSDAGDSDAAAQHRCKFDVKSEMVFTMKLNLDHFFGVELEFAKELLTKKEREENKKLPKEKRKKTKMFLRKITVSVRMGTGQTEEFKYDKDLGVAKPEPLQELAKKGGVVDNLINWATALTTIFSKFKSFKE